MTVKKLALILCALATAVQFSGCTSSSSSADGNTDEQFAEEGGTDFADGSDASDSTDGNPDELNLDDSSSSGEVASGEASSGEGELSLDDSSSSTASSGAAQSTDDLEADLGGLPDDVASQNPPTDAPPVEAAPPQDVAVTEPPPEAPPQDLAATEPPPEAPVADMAPPPAPVSFAPLQKIKTAAFMSDDGTLLNRVYLGRKGDTVKKVAADIYGSEGSAKEKSLRKWNRFLARRGVRVGDKIYYTSPTNPTDQSMLTFYEEIGIPPQIHISGPGENIRSLSSQFLGHKDSWKEVWSTNLAIESKGDLPAGTEIKYWPESVVATAMAARSAGGQPMAPAPPPADMAAAPPPPPPGMAGDMSNDPLAPPPPMNDPLAAAPPSSDPLAPPPGADPLAPPPPPPSDPLAAAPPSDPLAGSAGTVGANDPLAPPPPPPPVEEPAKKPMPVPDVAAAGDGDQTMFMVLIGLVLLAAAGALIVIRKNKAKKMDLGQTQI